MAFQEAADPRPFSLTMVHPGMDTVIRALGSRDRAARHGRGNFQLSFLPWKGAGPGVGVRQSLPGDGRRMLGP